MMQDYYALYTWAMDKQAAMQQETAQRRLIRRSRNSRWALRWPIVRRQAPVDHESSRHSGLAA